MTAHPDTHYERERRFIVSDPSIVDGWPWVLITQAYLWESNGYTARVRLIQKESGSGEISDLDATFAIKGPRIGDERFEAENSLPDLHVAKEIIRLASAVVRKRRYQVVDVESYDVDVFLDENGGLIIAELEGSGVRGVRRPEWCGEEITTREDLNNEILAFRPLNTRQEPS